MDRSSIIRCSSSRGAVICWQMPGDAQNLLRALCFPRLMRQAGLKVDSACHEADLRKQLAGNAHVWEVERILVCETPDEVGALIVSLVKRRSAFLQSLPCFNRRQGQAIEERNLSCWPAVTGRRLFCGSCSACCRRFKPIGLQKSIDSRWLPLQVLRIPSESGPSTVKTAFRKISMMVHPDKNKSDNASKAMQAVTAAFRSMYLDGSSSKAGPPPPAPAKPASGPPSRPAGPYGYGFRRTSSNSSR